MRRIYECNCGPYGSCSFHDGQKTCNCRPSAFEKNGICIIMESTTSESTTALRTTMLPSTTQYCNCGEYSKSCRYNWKGDKICDCFPGYAEKYGSCDECDCGPRGKCTLESGQKKCLCDPFTSERDGRCVECYCGENSNSCHLSWKGDKICNCTSGYAQFYGFCYDCNCGVNAKSCFYRKNGTKVCNCDVGYTQTNGYCSAICSEEKCVHGKCEIMGNGFKCRCNEGFTGQRCEEKIQIKSNYGGMDERYTNSCPNLSSYPLRELDCPLHQSQKQFLHSVTSPLRPDVLYSSSADLPLLNSSETTEYNAGEIIFRRFMRVRLANG
ncbi:hypothetical protein AVEN_256739-2 [Araneus ventricosus]|uniref:EGF-like domain-containing protein n=1 Tax=Araneus ventricosus TaxID=182803 RepID=A0A4Y2FS37_ARAVE|nr:hypothetical protein AVEN_256739-2 [Araneus ventricosus]